MPAGARNVTIASRRAVPVETEAASADERRLGVAVEQIVLRGAGLRVEIGPIARRCATASMPTKVRIAGPTGGGPCQRRRWLALPAI